MLHLHAVLGHSADVASTGLVGSDARRARRARRRGGADASEPAPTPPVLKRSRSESEAGMQDALIAPVSAAADSGDQGPDVEAQVRSMRGAQRRRLVSRCARALLGHTKDQRALVRLAQTNVLGVVSYLASARVQANTLTTPLAGGGNHGTAAPPQHAALQAGHALPDLPTTGDGGGDDVAEGAAHLAPFVPLPKVPWTKLARLVTESALRDMAAVRADATLSVGCTHRVVQPWRV